MYTRSGRHVSKLSKGIYLADMGVYGMVPLRFEKMVNCWYVYRDHKLFCVAETLALGLDRV